jgi:serine/threonine-protein kinase
LAARKLNLTALEWTLGVQIGDRSGFAKVFEATAGNGALGVLKLILKQPGADRELLFEELSNVPNIVPIIDTGETDDEWVIAMPRAERSLRAELEAVGGRMTAEQAVPILIDIARALVAIDGRVVHRDLKPENVLLLDGAWCLADFGIAKYWDASTAPDTWKDAWTAAYAAPERWRSETATGATDVYSLGVIGYELVMGARPFQGPTREDYRRQHVTEPPPPASDAPAALASLIAECMHKPPGARPTPASALARLERMSAPPSPAAGRLQEANRQIEAANAEALARESAQQSERERREMLVEVAKRTLESVSSQMRQAVIDNAPSAQTVRSNFDDWSVQLGSAVIGMDPTTLSDPGSWGPWRPKFEVIAYAAIGVTIPQDRNGYTGRTHTLFYSDAQEEGVFRWFETAFMVMPLMPQRTSLDPFALAPGELAGKALSRTMAESQVAWPFMPFDQGEEQQFIDRWLEWFGMAASGQLRHPASMPERPPQGSYRD